MNLARCSVDSYITVFIGPNLQLNGRFAIEKMERKEERSVYQAARCNQKPIWYSRCSAFSPPRIQALRSTALSRNRNAGLIDSPGPGTAKYSYVSFHGRCTTEKTKKRNDFSRHKPPRRLRFNRKPTL